MHPPLLRRSCGSLFAVLLLVALPLRAHEATNEMSTAAHNFLSALTPEQKTKAQFPFEDAERKNWHFIPRPRKGLPIKEMTQEQRLLAQALLVTGLSNNGYSKAVSIMSLEAVLAELEKGKVGAPARDPEMYFVTVFGEPSTKAPWGWRVEGHHLSLNFACPVDASPAMTPSFFGTNPGEVRLGPRIGTRILGAEEELGRQLVKSLSDDQRKEAMVLPEAPKEIFNDPKRAEPTNPEGIVATRLSPDQSAMLAKIIHEYLSRNRPDVAEEEFGRIEKAGLGKIRFTWAGGIDRGQPHYYRVQGESFVLEYDNTQNEANHVHSVWRDFAHDFGEDVLKAHRDQAHRTP